MQIEWLPSALLDLQKLREFIRQHNPDAVRRAGRTIRKAVATLQVHPGLGTEVEDLSGFYDLIIPFASRNYVLRYRIYRETVFIVALRHAREVGFSED
ncbi:MAG: type II toxin-antitoxin system RelE/ParE family toxin [Desulfuromonadales bacterium]|nr:type II toxin-antitoxin system RelE/ParE family toxin [Desulfuromonadales bacterium]